MFSSKSTAENTKKNFFLLAAILDAENWKKKISFQQKNYNTIDILNYIYL